MSAPPPPAKSTPGNYYEIQTVVAGKPITLAGLSNPKNAKIGQLPNEKGVMRSLKEDQQIDVLISLHEKHDSEPSATSQGLECHHVRLDDYTEKPHNPEDLQRIYDIVKDAAQQGKKVAICCGAGDGRTGVALSSVVMRSLLEERPAMLDSDTHPTQVVEVCYAPFDAEATPLVYGAVSKVRGDSGNHSYVERVEDVTSLNHYETYLKTQCRESIQAGHRSAENEGGDAGPGPQKPDPPEEQDTANEEHRDLSAPS